MNDDLLDQEYAKEFQEKPPPPKPRPMCQTCLFWYSYHYIRTHEPLPICSMSPRYGQCRKDTPQLTVKGETDWPSTHPRQGCAQHETRRESE